MLYFGSPAFFVDASDGLMLERPQRIIESALGPYSEMILAGLGSILLVAFPGASFDHFVYKFCVLNYFLIFENLIPLLELDGYFILSEAIEVPDLRERSLQFIQHDLWHKLREHDGLSKQEIGLGTYAVIGIVFTILSVDLAIFFWKEIFGSLVSALWNGGTGSQLLLLLMVALFVAGPANPRCDHPGSTTIKRLLGRLAEDQVQVRDLVAGRGSRDDRRAACVRRAPRRCLVRPRGPRALGDILSG